MSEYVFESPDGGKTVYRRKVGSAERELYIADRGPRLVSWGEWTEIMKTAQEHPALMEAIDKLIVIYNLCKDKE